MQERKIIKVTVKTYDAKDEQVGYDREIDMCDGLHAAWLRKHIFWAASNGMAVEIDPRPAS